MADESIILERTQELTWALLDDQITNDELSLLDSLLLSDDAARKRYTDCVHLHADLMAHFAAKEPREAVLNSLTTGLPAGLEFPSTEGTAS